MFMFPVNTKATIYNNKFSSSMHRGWDICDQKSILQTIQLYKNKETSGTSSPEAELFITMFRVKVFISWIILHIDHKEVMY